MIEDLDKARTLEAQNLPFLQLDEVRAVFAALEGAVLVVGGAVRDALMGREVGDVDMATPYLPDEVAKLAEAAGLKVHPTGIEHGTLTLALGKRTVEVTSFRKDVSTDGRRATVSFTRSAREDAARRDFTINALYADQHGVVYDFFGGLEDIAPPKVKFIGEAAERIAEDYLRILRLFRFAARFGPDSNSAHCLAAAKNAAPQLKTLSRERVRQEMLKLLDAPFAPETVREMHQCGVLSFVSDLKADLDGFSKAVANETAFGLAPDAVRRLLALYQKTSSKEALRSDFVLTNKEMVRLEKLENYRGNPQMQIPEAVYYFGSEAVIDALVLGGEAGDLNRVQEAQAVISPVFPLSGQELMDKGFLAGPELGKTLKLLEKEWVKAGFSLTKSELLAKL